MPLRFNIRHLEDNDLRLKGELSIADLDMDVRDEVIHVGKPLAYDVRVEKLDKGILVHGSLRLPLTCECVRCLKPFPDQIALENWTCHLPLEGEEKIAVTNDVVDLTPYVREDILLAFPQHPLCEPECKGLVDRKDRNPGNEREPTLTSSAWAELDKLKLRE
jgi:uncharacterized protein